ncbi:MAG: WD40/YVTN/BNR-like repeat-containing protein [Chitinophagaceae bacterium]
MNRKHFFIQLLVTTITIGVFGQQPSSPLVASFKQYQSMKEKTTFNLEWISLGPVLNSARADVVQVDPMHPGTMFVGFGSGGLWKTINNGISWSCIFEGQPSLGIGDMELAPSNPSIIYLGSGENLKKPRNFTLPGTGMYRSSDAGKTWKHIGLEDSWSIAEIAIHPTNPDIVLVAVLGHLWTTNKNRGLFRTTNGGKTWEQVLYVDDKTGANDIAISPKNPSIMYASTWEVYPGISGKNSSVYKSIDGGKNWKLIANGLPSGPKTGRIGLAVSASNPLKVYALIDNLNNDRDNAAELYKTTDGGLTWNKTHKGPFKIFPGVGWYFTDVYVNPKNDEEVFCLGVRLAHSMDGGKSFSFIGGNVTRMNQSLAQGLHLDQCELWINPSNPNHIAVGNDGGFYVSYDKGLSWMHYNNIPVGEFYDITIDKSSYTIYGGTQDDATVYGPAKEINTRFPDPWKYVWIDPWDGGDGCVTQVDPENNSTVYYSMQHGNAVRLDRDIDTAIGIMPELPKEIKDTLRFNYITPYFISPHQSKTLYHGGNFVFKSIDRGDHWKVISPNIANSSIIEKKSNALGALVESKMEKGLIYAGTDKGSVWVTKNDGVSWEEHSIGLANYYIRSICPSSFSKERVYLAMTGINQDDLHRYLYSSDNYGKNWKNISIGLPDEPINTVLEDPTNENILYAGTLRGVYISTNKGINWSYLGNQLPGAAIADLEIHEPTMDLIAATHGRGLYKINLKSIQEMVKENWPATKDRLFEFSESIKRPWFNSSAGEPDYRTVEKTSFYFWLEHAKSITLSITDTSNKEIWKTNLLGKEGFNQYRWDLVIKKETSDYPYFVHYEKFLKAGKYKLLLLTGDRTLEQQIVVRERTSPYIEKEK